MDLFRLRVLSSGVKSFELRNRNEQKDLEEISALVSDESESMDVSKVSFRRTKGGKDDIDERRSTCQSTRYSSHCCTRKVVVVSQAHISPDSGTPLIID